MRARPSRRASPGRAREKPDFLIASAPLAQGGAGEDVAALTLHTPLAMMAACVMVNRRD